MKRTTSPWTPTEQQELHDLAEQIVRIRSAREPDPPTVQGVETAMTDLLQIMLEWERAHAACPNAKRASAARSVPATVAPLSKASAPPTRRASPGLAVEA